MSTEIDNHAFQNLLFSYLKDSFLFLLIKFSNILTNLSIVAVSVIQAFLRLFWEKHVNLKDEVLGRCYSFSILNILVHFADFHNLRIC